MSVPSVKTMLISREQCVTVAQHFCRCMPKPSDIQQYIE